MVITITLFLALFFKLVTMFGSLVVFWFLIKLVGVPLRDFWNTIYFLR